MRARVRQRDQRERVDDEVAHDLLVRVEQAREELHVEPVGGDQIEPGVDRDASPSRWARSARLTPFERLVLRARHTQHLDEVPSTAEDGEALRVEVGLERGAEVGIAVDARARRDSGSPITRRHTGMPSKGYGFRIVKSMVSGRHETWGSTSTPSR